MILECMSVRLHGHAAYDKADYVSAEQMERDAAARSAAGGRGDGSWTVCAMPKTRSPGIEQEVDEEIHGAVARALAGRAARSAAQPSTVYARDAAGRGQAVPGPQVKNGDAVSRALDYMLANHPQAFLAGLDVGTYGSAFKTCKGLIDRYGAERVIDMPLCESGVVGFALGASQVGGEPIVEFQFADFSTEAATQTRAERGHLVLPHAAGRPRCCCGCPAAAG